MRNYLLVNGKSYKIKNDFIYNCIYTYVLIHNNLKKFIYSPSQLFF